VRGDQGEHGDRDTNVTNVTNGSNGSHVTHGRCTHNPGLRDQTVCHGTSHVRVVTLA
jgi:hypothetical protein